MKQCSGLLPLLEIVLALTVSAALTPQLFQVALPQINAVADLNRQKQAFTQAICLNVLERE
jgi:hypothetical protein